MKISILVEGKTEQAFSRHLRTFLQSRLAGRMPRLDPFPYHGRIPKEARLRRIVENLLQTGNPPADAVIALTDVYTGSDDFLDAQDAKTKMKNWVGANNVHFYPHVALHDFEAWLLPYWSDIQRISGHNRNPPPGAPETVNHQRPPSYHIREIFRVGTCRDDYVKPRDADRILRGQNLADAAVQCPELRSFLNTILELCGGQVL
jgi:hypothetical protein